MGRPPQEFPGQFLIGPPRSPVPPRFRSILLPVSGETVTLAADDRLGAFPLRVNGGDAGLVLGDPIAIAQRRMVDSPFELAMEGPVTQRTVSDAVMDAFGGSFLFILTVESQSCVYLDASATLGLVYDPESRTAASSAELLLGGAYASRLNAELIAQFGAERDGWFTAGLTAHDGLYRLLPNHRLDLASFASERHWPLSLPEYCPDPLPAVRAIGQEIADATVAILSARPAAQCLTGGNETRALLAANRACRGEMQFVTVCVPGSGLDIELAGRLAKLTGIEHHLLPCKRASAAQADAWRKGAGHALSGGNHFYHPTVEPLTGKVLIGGLGGEVGRGFLWPGDLNETTQITASLLLNRLKLPQHPLLLARLERWFDSLPPDLDPWQILDLAYLELRNGPWAFGQPYLSRGPRNIHPLISRKQFLRMWSLPPRFRKHPGFLGTLIDEFWPEIGAIPINSYGDWRDKLALIRKGVQRPDRAWRKAKQIIRQKMTG